MNIKLKSVAFWGLLAGGLGCGIGAIFVPPLVAVSVACLSGAAAVAQVREPSQRVDPTPTPAGPAPESSESASQTEFDLHLRLGKNRHRNELSFSRQVPALVDNKSDEQSYDTSSEALQEKVRHRHRP